MQPTTKVSERRTTAGSGEPIDILSFTGDISSTSRDAVLEGYATIPTTVKSVLLDFRGVEYINSSGIAIVIQLLLQASKAGHHRVGIFGLSPHFTKVFTMVGVAKYATMFPDEATALAAM